MPSLVITGHPCVGKTTFTRLLAERALKHSSGSITSVVVIDDELASPDRTKAQCYADSRAEKFTRGALKATFDKHLTSDSGDGAAGGRTRRLVVLDSLNYIKGFRYELHCIAKAAGEKHGIVWVMCDSNTAKGWNRRRREQRKEQVKDSDYFYSDEVMDELVRRYEPPDQRNRWDRPLYRVDVGSTLEWTEHVIKTKETGGSSKAAEDALKRSVYNMHELSKDIASASQSAVSTASSSRKSSSAFRRKAAPRKENKKEEASEDATLVQSEWGGVTGETNTSDVRKMEDLIDEILDSFLIDVAPLKEGKSTAKHVAADANMLHAIDSITQQVCSDFLASQKNILTVGSGKITVPTGRGHSRTVELARVMQITELKRTRRQYVKWVADHPPEDTSETGIASSFLSYIEAQM